MAVGDEVTLLRVCGRCGAELETFSVRKENMMLCSRELVWCPHCQAETPELRDIAGRRESIRQELATYAKNEPLA